MRFFLFILYFFLLSCSNHSEIEHGYHIEKIEKYYLEFTVKGRGPILLVGHPTSGKIAYENSLQPLEKYFTIVYYNTRGIGNSDTPQTYYEYQDKYLTKEIDDLRKKLNIKKIWLFGHSDQSAIALQYAIDYSDNINGLILSGTGFIDSFEQIIKDRTDFETNRKNNERWFQQVVNDWDYMIKFKVNSDSLGKDLSYAPIKWWCYNEDTFRKVKPIYDSILKVGKRNDIPNQINTNTTQQNIENYIPYQEKFNQIKIPILIINGKYDTNNPPKKVKKLHRVLQNSDLYFIDKSGHFPWIEQKEETFSIIEKWLNKTLQNNRL